MAKKLMLSAAVALAVGGFSTMSMMQATPAQATGWSAHAPGMTLGERWRAHWAAKKQRKRIWWHEKKARKWGHRRAHVAAPAAPPPAAPPRRYRPIK